MMMTAPSSLFTQLQQQYYNSSDIIFISTIDQSHEDLNYMERTIYIYVKTELRVLGLELGKMICCCPLLISVNNNNLGLEEWLHNLCSNLFVAAATSPLISQ